jgi:undecaprenyl-diphosphatase
MTISQILILAVVQGAAELLPVSSSAHVIVAEKLMRLDPTSPEMTLLLVMLHTGTMFAVIFFFWNSWKRSFFSSRPAFWNAVKLVTTATVVTGILGLLLKAIIEKFVLRDVPHAEVELLFGNLGMISGALAAVGILVMWARWKDHSYPGEQSSVSLHGAQLYLRNSGAQVAFQLAGTRPLVSVWYILSVCFRYCLPPL